MELINSKEIFEKFKQQIKTYINLENVEPHLEIIQVGHNTASDKYVNTKKRVANELGIAFNHFEVDESISEKEIIKSIKLMNENPMIDGIIVQLPLPSHLNERRILNSISYSKDVDGLSNAQMGVLTEGYDTKTIHYPCTAFGVFAILKEITNLCEQDVVIVNRSHLIGVPLSRMLTQENATVTVCHSKTKNLKEKMLSADIIVTGIGKAKYFDSSYFKDGQIIIDCSMNFDNGKLCGDVDVETLKDKNVRIASGPGHTGPMTVASLMFNTTLSCIKNVR